MGLKRVADTRHTNVEGTISFGEKYVESDSFKNVFREGMALVEEAAGYLEGTGRTEAKKLQPELSFAYATESMRLTTRLMQLASWLLIRRAVNEGEMTMEQAEQEEHKVKLQAIGSLARAKGYDDLPVSMKDLVERSLRFYDRILKLDRMIRETSEKDEQGADGNNPLSHHFGRLKAAFETNGES
jgi:regulator of CtrA degradation